MTKAELVAQVALQTALTHQQTAEVVDLFLQCIIEALQEGDKVGFFAPSLQMVHSRNYAILSD